VTNLKTANADLAAAIAALESQEHAADLTEAAAIRDRLSALDERIGGRMRAKIEAHRAIVAAWGMSEAAPELDTPDGPIVVAEPVPTAAAWDTHHAASVGTYALSGDEVPEAVAVMANGVVEAERVGA